MEIPENEELTIITDSIVAFYTQLTDKGLPTDLAALLTRDFFNSMLNWVEGDGGEDDEEEDNELPHLRPWGLYPEILRFYVPGL